MLAALKRFGSDLRVGYSGRYKERYQIAKEQEVVAKGRVGTLTGGAARVFNSAFAGVGDAQAQSARHAGGGCAD